MSNNKILVAPPYNHYFEVTPEQFAMVINLPMWYQKYESGYKYSIVEGKPEFQILSKEDIKQELPEEVIEIEKILEENNRLSRELEQLKSKLGIQEVSTSTEVAEIYNEPL